MRKHPKNECNGGTEFAEINGEMESAKECVLDKLMKLDKSSLLNMLSDRTIADNNKTEGQLIMKIMEEKIG